jgi:hypothetical protein
MRTVFSNDMVAHVWAQQDQDHGRNSNDSISFHGSTISSYSMRIAKFLDCKNVLFTSEGYSVTTSQHKNIIRQAISSYCDIFTVPEIEITIGTKHNYTKEQNKKNHKINLAFYKKEIDNTVLSAARARSNKQWLEQQALDLVNECNLYIDTFKLRNKHVELPNKDQILEDAKKAQKSKARKEKARIKQLLIDSKEKIEKWCNGESVSIPRNIDTMVRIKGEDIQTSQNATFPIKHAKLALKIIENCRKNKEIFKKNGRSIKLGYFEIDSIDHNGNVKAGCHYVKYEQIERIADQVKAS